MNLVDQDKWKLPLAVLLLVAGVVGFYLLNAQHGVVRWASVLGGVLLGFGLFFWSHLGHTFLAYARDSFAEARKVVWPSRKETWQVTLVVFGFVLVLALFLWGVDSFLAWLFYDVILGRGV